MQLIKKTNIDFLKYRKWYFLVTGVIFLLGIGSLLTQGLNFGLEFTGGTLVQVSFDKYVDIKDVRSVLEKEGLNPEIQSFSDKDAFIIKIKGDEENVNETSGKVEAAVKTLGAGYKVDRTEFVGPAVGKDMSKKAILALLLALSAMVIYIAFRFTNIVWGASGVIGIFHDVCVMVFAFSFLQLEVDLIIVAALLTVAGFSINDNIVIYDRMRENIKDHPKMRMYDIINLSVNETLSRTIITGGTTLIAVVILFFMGGPALKNFSLAMIIGVVFGTYSTIAVATPLVYQWAHRNDESTDMYREKKEEASLYHDTNAQKGGQSYKERKRNKNKHR